MVNPSEAWMGLRINRREWRFSDLRIDIPPASFGSDAINPHTQYSNPIARFDSADASGIGASFTLGAGNEMVCAAAELIVNQLDGATVGDLIGDGFHRTLTNPRQLRWLSPNSGVPMMAAGLVVNTLIDAAAKIVGLPAWEFLARLPTGLLMSLVDVGAIADESDVVRAGDLLENSLAGVEKRCATLRETGIPVYFTTWIGHSAEAIAEQMHDQYDQRGIYRFKLKIGPDLTQDIAKLAQVRALVSEDFELCVDANQTLTVSQAKRWLDYLSESGYFWLEEPFAPDNVAAFEALCRYRRDRALTTEVVTGENCPNVHTAVGLMVAGIDRFQSDPCRMFGVVDPILSSALAGVVGCVVTPHAGGSGLDELSPHLQLFNLARVATDVDPADSLTENVGFSSRFFAAPTIVADGRAFTPDRPGLLVGLAPDVTPTLTDYKEGATWLAL